MCMRTRGRRGERGREKVKTSDDTNPKPPAKEPLLSTRKRRNARIRIPRVVTPRRRRRARARDGSDTKESKQYTIRFHFCRSVRSCSSGSFPPSSPFPRLAVLLPPSAVFHFRLYYLCMRIRLLTLTSPPFSPFVSRLLFLPSFPPSRSTLTCLRASRRGAP